MSAVRLMDGCFKHNPKNSAARSFDRSINCTGGLRSQFPAVLGPKIYVQPSILALLAMIDGSNDGESWASKSVPNSSCMPCCGEEGVRESWRASAQG